MSSYVFSSMLLSVFVLTLSKTFDAKQGNKILVVTGRDVYYNHYPESEVIDLRSNNGGDCDGWTEYPIEIEHGTGALFSIDSEKGTEGRF